MNTRQPFTQDPIIARNQLLAKLSRARQTGNRPEFTCEAEIRRTVIASVNAKASALNMEPQGGPAMIDNWIKFVCEKAKDEGRLLTNRQYQDWCVGRRLMRGDRARFVGESRTEELSNGATSTRPSGQVGTITALEKVDGAEIATFFPHDPVMVTEADGTVSQKLVNLQVRVGTREWYDLERVG